MTTQTGNTQTTRTEPTLSQQQLDEVSEQLTFGLRPLDDTYVLDWSMKGGPGCHPADRTHVELIHALHAAHAEIARLRTSQPTAADSSTPPDSQTGNFAQVTASQTALARDLHAAFEWHFDYCDHGTYTGGPNHGEPYAACERIAKRLVESAAARRRDNPAAQDERERIVNAIAAALCAQEESEAETKWWGESTDFVAELCADAAIGTGRSVGVLDPAVIDRFDQIKQRAAELAAEREEASADADRQTAGMREVALFRAANASALLGGLVAPLISMLDSALPKNPTAGEAQ